VGSASLMLESNREALIGLPSENVHLAGARDFTASCKVAACAQGIDARIAESSCP
jgi:hypothetical protein